MRKLIVLASVAAMVAMVGGLWAQNDAPAPPQGGQGGHGMRGGHQGGPGGQRPEMGPMQMLEMAMMQATMPWATADAEAQQLLDKVIAARKQVMQDEQSRLAAYEKVVASARAGDKDAAETGRKGLKDASEKLREDMKAMGDAGRALGEKLRAIRPEGEGPKGGDGNAPQGGHGKGGQRQGGAKKDGM